MLAILSIQGITEYSFQTAQKGISSAIVTSSGSDAVRHVIDTFDLGKVTHACSVSHKVPVLFRMLRERMVLPVETLFITDTDSDVRAGKQVGMVTVGITGGFHTSGRMKARYSVCSLKDILTL